MRNVLIPELNYFPLAPFKELKKKNFIASLHFASIIPVSVYTVYSIGENNVNESI